MLATKFRRPLAVGSLGLGLAISLAACGGSADEPMNDPSSSAPSSSAAPSDSSSPSDSMTEGSMDPAAMLVGSGCAAYAEQVPDGAGSVDGMAQAPVGTAASNNPILTTLTSAVSGGVNPNVNLVDTLNDPSAQYTVFAPVDDAFAKIPAETLASLSEGDGTALSSILTYHVLPERINPDDIDGTHTTVQGEDLTVEGSGDNITVNGNSAVICGGVQTANATVYLVDTVLMPPSTMQ